MTGRERADDAVRRIPRPLTGERPNCYFEAGYAHALRKQLILTIRKGEKVHFNLAERRFIEWATGKELLDAHYRRLESIRAAMPDARGMAMAAGAGGGSSAGRTTGGR